MFEGLLKTLSTGKTGLSRRDRGNVNTTRPLAYFCSTQAALRPGLHLWQHRERRRKLISHIITVASIFDTSFNDLHDLLIRSRFLPENPETKCSLEGFTYKSAMKIEHGSAEHNLDPCYAVRNAILVRS
ncbi:hypothetical protein CVT26_013323 [Gymnopilus dilepis]|uniref:Uncharacterized protein n=1 Tax=Gymnopilus dilepis TaxID=231916 RepID=A0A409YF24_9AGAR|nr:hypothetical protein CVT26_013323 [Gymnopilus dilepis]